MTERVLGPTGGRRRKRLALLVPFLALAALILAMGASGGPIGAAIGFEDDDGNLVDNTPFFNAGPPATGDIDWNNFDPTTWTGSTPSRQATTSFNGFQFLGLEDAQAVTSDSNFNGGVKQDDDCAALGTGKSSNKDDLKRVYVASKTGTNGHTYLQLAWVRIPQNTTSPSAHIGFEFNQNDGTGTTGCGSGSPLVKRSTANGGDMLVVYDFEGGSGDAPTITIRRWVGSGSCEVSSDSAPCWGPAVNVTASGSAEAKVNTTATALDTIGPSDETLGINEFGEAGIDLTAALVFPAGQCRTFGKVYGVSRSSGNSGTAQMKDLAGPGNFSLTNCGEIKIIKHTDPGDINQNFSFTSDIPNAASCSADSTPGAFMLNDNGTDTQDCTNVPGGSYAVDEPSAPAGWGFKSLNCSASTGSSVDPTSSTSDHSAAITLVGGGVVVCTYVNERLTGAINLLKLAKNANCGGSTPPTGCSSGKAPVSGATFQLCSNAGPYTAQNTCAQVGSNQNTGTDGKTCFSGLAFAAYHVHEVSASGYQLAADQTETISSSSTCATTSHTPTFENVPLSSIQVKFTSLAGAGITNAQIVCKTGGSAVAPVSENGGTADNDATPVRDDTDETFTNLPGTGVYTCTVDIDP